MRLACFLVVLTSVLLLPRPSNACEGDCNGNGVVAVDELVRALAVALDAASIESCEPADVDGDAAISIADMVVCVAIALNGCPAPTPTATPSGTTSPTPRFSLTPTPTRTSCVSDPPGIRSQGTGPSTDHPLRWRFEGWSRVLLHGRGGVLASLDCGTLFRVSGSTPGEYYFEVDLHPGVNLVSVCTDPSACGTPYCRQRRIDCDASSCADIGDLPPVPRRELQCQAQ